LQIFGDAIKERTTRSLSTSRLYHAKRLVVLVLSPTDAPTYSPFENIQEELGSLSNELVVIDIVAVDVEPIMGNVDFLVKVL
jgi:hypothetical protein